MVPHRVPFPANHYHGHLVTNNSQVTDYLLKKGYTRTEAAFRREIANVNANEKGVQTEGGDQESKNQRDPEKYLVAIAKLENWVDNNLDLYKVRSPQHPIL
jgi:transcription initiation factor TFIID subunit 5